MKYTVKFFANGEWFSTARANYLTNSALLSDGIYGKMHAGTIEQAIFRHVDWFEARLSFIIIPHPVESFSVPIPISKRKFYDGKERLYEERNQAENEADT